MAVAGFIKSPAQAAADTRPPAASVLTAAVERKVLAETVITRGTVASSQQVDVGGAGLGEKDAGRSVVTRVSVKSGESLRMGQLLLEVSGRPVFVLQGALPAYRDLKAGCVGEDVAQFQNALAALGYSSGDDRTGMFGGGTAHAATLFYRAHDIEPVTEEVSPVRAGGEGTAAAGSPTRASTASDQAGAASARVTSQVIVPMSEIAYVRASPAYVGQVSAHVGEEAKSDLLSISAGTLIVNGSVGPDVRGLVKPGQKAIIASEATGARAEATVVSIAAQPTKPDEDTDQAGAETYAVRVQPSGRMPADWVGEDVRITITAASSKEVVLAVPTSAVAAGADGRTTVTVRRGQTERRVAVDTGMTADGYVQVIPEGADLEAGERVVVGVDGWERAKDK
ncbi:peptidoglycan-binding protein [Streptomyces sp. NPDC048410]|uniref:peptidoglycan-binding protein n=1 Tax=Streptomyces sp. NPDC048410 TaxID=3365545 RepID=UPI003712C2EA